MVTSRRNSCSSLTIRADFGGAEAGHRLVEQQQLRFRGERDRKFELALLAMAQFGNHVSARRPSPTRASADLRRVAKVLFLAGIAPEPEGVPVMRLRRHRDIVGRGEIGQATR